LFSQIGFFYDILIATQLPPVAAGGPRYDHFSYLVKKQDKERKKRTAAL
jgi:hypothetical protein